jgi:DNA topoisomerase IA
MNLAQGTILVERRSKAEAFAALLGGHWNVVCLSGSLPERVFDQDVARVNLEKNQRLAVQPELAEMRRRLSGPAAILLVTDPTLMGEAAAAMMARVLELHEPMRIDLYEISEEGLARAMQRARRIEESRVLLYEKVRSRDERLGLLCRSTIQSVMGRTDFFPSALERVLLGAVVDRDRSMRLAGQAFTDQTFLQVDHWKAVLDHPDGRLIELPASRQHATVLACTTLAVPDPTPPALNFPGLVHAARVRFGFGAIEVMDFCYQLYLRGLITWPFTTSLRQDSRGVKAMWEYAQRNRLPVRDSREALQNRPPKSSRGHAIRPVDTEQTTLEAAQHLKDLYALIHERALLCVLMPSIAKQRTITIEVKSGKSALRFVAESLITMSRGWRVAASAGSVPGPWDDQAALPLLNPGDRVEANLKRERVRREDGGPRFSEETIGLSFAHVPYADCSDWYRTLKNLRDREFVRIRAGEISPTPFGVSVMHAIRSMKDERSTLVPSVVQRPSAAVRLPTS